MDICSTTKLDVHEPTYLIATDTIRSFKKCECFVNNGLFLFNVTDLRLKSKNGRNCSSTKLKINTDHFPCNIAKQDFGSRFNSKILDLPEKNLFISLRSLSVETVPDMIWLTLIPKGKRLLSYQQIKFVEHYVFFDCFR